MQRRGVTLIELIIYVALFVLVAGSFVSFGLSVSGTRNKTYVATEVQENARIALDKLAYDIRRADGIIVPASGGSGAALTLNIPGPDNVSYALASGVLQRTLGANPAVDVTGPRVNISSVTFEHIGTGSKKNVKITMTVEYARDSSTDFTFSKTYQTSVSLRK